MVINLQQDGHSDCPHHPVLLYHLGDLTDGPGPPSRLKPSAADSAAQTTFTTQETQPIAVVPSLKFSISAPDQVAPS